MGIIAKKLIHSFRRNSIKPGRKSQEFSEDLPDDALDPAELEKSGYDRQHIAYIVVQQAAMDFAQGIASDDNFAEFDESLHLAEDKYLPSGPPISPITSSYFWTWALFDLRFGPDRETAGSCLLELIKTIEAPRELLKSLENYDQSRMGVYQQIGSRGGKLLLRELVTGSELLCHIPTGFKGAKHVLYFMRLCPPVNATSNYHTAVTTPYVLTGTTAEDWTEFLNKLMPNATDRRQALHELLKFGNESVNWMEFVFQAFHHEQGDAIFLKGIPDVPASLPHAPKSVESNEIVTSAWVPVGYEQVFEPVRLTEAQRKVLASLCPNFASRMRLTEKNPRTIYFTPSEMELVRAECRKALAAANGSTKNTLTKILASCTSGNQASASRSQTSTSRKSVSTSMNPSSVMANPATSKATTIYQFKITLKQSDPPIWRRIQVSDCSLAKFHDCIQNAMGWHDAHLHEFNIAGLRYAAPPPVDDGFMDDEEDAIDASTVKLSQLIGRQSKFRCDYVYDFGDGWEHKIELEKICEPEPKARYPRCIDGAQACPPEDCGGIWGYYDYVKAVTDRKHPEHDEMLQWSGPFDPHAFDRDEATRAMRRDSR